MRPSEITELVFYILLIFFYVSLAMNKSETILRKKSNTIMSMCKALLCFRALVVVPFHPVLVISLQG